MNILTACTTSLYIVVVQLLNLVWLRLHGLQHIRPACPSVSWSLFRLMSIVLVMPSNHLILCHLLLFLLLIFPSIRVFSSELALHIKWPKYWSFNLSISPYNEYSGLISFRTDWFDLLAVQGTLKSLLQHHSESISSWALCLLGLALTSIHDYWKDHSFDYTLWAKWCLCFLIHCLGLS